MKTPIEVKDIRKGDLIREEYEGGGRNLSYPYSTAIEYVATHSHHTLNRGNAARWYLLDRPTPPVQLPTEPTLGWMAVAQDGTGGPGNLLAVWRKRVNGNFDGGHLGTWSPEYVTAFTPAVAVPKAALDELRDYRYAQGDIRTPAMERIITFLAAVDEANR